MPAIFTMWIFSQAHRNKILTIEILSWGFSVMFTSGNVRKSAKKRFLFTFQYSFFVGLAWRWEENENCFWGLATFICYFWSLKNSVKSIHQYSTHHSIGKRKIELASYFWMNEKVKFFNNKSQQKPALAQYFDIFRGWFSTRTRSVLCTVENWNLLKNSLQWQQFGNFLSLGTQFSSG